MLRFCLHGTKGQLIDTDSGPAGQDRGQNGDQLPAVCVGGRYSGAQQNTGEKPAQQKERDQYPADPEFSFQLLQTGNGVDLSHVQLQPFFGKDGNLRVYMIYHDLPVLTRDFCLLSWFQKQ